MTAYAITDTATLARIGVYKSKPIAVAKRAFKFHMWLARFGFDTTIAAAEQEFNNRYTIEKIEIGGF